MQTCLGCKLVKGKSCELLCLVLGGSAGGKCVSTIDRGEGDGNQAYKSWKILSNREAKGSSDGAGEGDFGEGCALEESDNAILSVGVRASLLVGFLSKLNNIGMSVCVWALKPNSLETGGDG